MAGLITHSWNGTILTITSDSGTSSMDLKGGSGDIGPRGPQGPAGIIINPDGTINFNGYATEQYVNDKVAEVEMGSVELENYYTKEETLALIPDTSDFATKLYVDQAIEAIDIEDIDLSNYYTKSEVDAAIESTMPEDGQDGVSATHSWNGSVLTITSASGTSSADLLGPEGPKGDSYVLTVDDKDEIAQLVLSALSVAEEGSY